MTGVKERYRQDLFSGNKSKDFLLLPIFDCVGASSVNMFKKIIDMYLRRAGYIYIDRLDSR